MKIYAFYSKSIIIAYLHLSLLGSISFLLLALLIDKKWLSITWIVKVGSSLLVAGFVVSELSLVLSGFNVFHTPEILLIGSASMAVGIFLMLISKTQKKSIA